MVRILTTAARANTLNAVFRQWAPALREIVELLPYPKACSARALPCGVYVFADHERMTAPQRNVAEQLWDQLAAGGCTLLNDPRKVLLRYDLLTSLHCAGINDFRIFRLHELPETLRFPVFVRGENDHAGPRSRLIHGRDDLDAEIVRLAAEGMADLIVVEFLDTRGADGFYRKYSAFRIGPRIFARHQLLDTEWMLKVPGVWNATRKAEETRYIEENPHRNELMRIFELANLQYGRVDYALHQGRIQVWEINTNPTLMSKRSQMHVGRWALQKHIGSLFLEAFQGLNEPDSEPIPIRIDAAPILTLGR